MALNVNSFWCIIKQKTKKENLKWQKKTKRMTDKIGAGDATDRLATQTPANNVAIVNYNYQEPTNQGLDCILNTGYENKLLPNSSYELYKQNKTYWMNETGRSRGVEL